MRFYQAEMEAFNFMKGYHTLKEWANYGYNKVIFNGETYWDGLHADGRRITDAENEQAGLLKWDTYDYDDDGYMYVELVRADENE